MQREDLYIELLKKVLIDFYRLDKPEFIPIEKGITWKSKLLNVFDQFLRKRKYAICRIIESSLETRVNGLDWPIHAETMIGEKRMDNIRNCVKSVIKENIPGDLIETGVWRGGTVIFMKGILNIYNINDRKVWVADSFEGLPKPNEEKYPADKGDVFYLQKELAVSLEEVQKNFRKYNLLDDNVVFLKGWFKDTLPNAPIKAISVLRLDGDMYESTMDALDNLYPKLSVGGYIIIDDYGAVEGCKKAVTDYREQMSIGEEIIPIDWAGVYWKKMS